MDLIRYFIKLLFTLAIGLVFSACSLSGNITTPGSGPVGPVLQKVSMGQIVAGTTSYQATIIRGYKVQAESGNFLGYVKLSTPSGYQVYSMQGTTF